MNNNIYNNNDREKRVMNFSQPRHTLSESTPPLLMHNFMPMPSSSSLHLDQDLSESDKKASFMNELKQNMQRFWNDRLSEICEAPTEVRTPHALPLARIKKVMKSDEKVKMISADTPVVLAKACEMFVMELSMRAWMHTQQKKRRTVQRNDIAYAIRDDHHDLLAFLHDLVPMESLPPHQDPNPNPNPNHPAGVYVPLPVRGMPPMYFNQHNLPNQSEVDHHSGFPMNLQDNLNHHGFFRRSEAMQHINPGFQPPSPSADGTNPYLTFKDFFQ